VKIIDIDYYAEYGDSRLNRLPARIKLSVILTIIAAVIFSDNVFVLGGIYFILLAIILISSVPKRKIIKLSLFPLMFLVLFIVSIHNVSLETIFIFLFKALNASTSLVLLVFTTNYTKIFGELNRFLPDFIVNILFLTYRSIFILARTLENLLNMLKFRGKPPVKKPVLFLKTLGNIVGFFVIKSIQTGENLYDAMRLRGYSDSFKYLQKDTKRTG